MRPLRSFVLSLLALAGARGLMSVVAAAMAFIMGLVGCGIQPLTKPGASPSATAGAGCISFPTGDGKSEIWCPPAPSGFRQVSAAATPTPSPSPAATPSLQDLIARLGPPPTGYEWVIIGGQIALRAIAQPGPYPYPYPTYPTQPQMPGQAPAGYQWIWSGSYWTLVPIQTGQQPGYIPCIGCPVGYPTYYPYPYPTVLTGTGINVPPIGTTIMGWDMTTRVVTFRGINDLLWAADVVPASPANPSDPSWTPAAVTAAVKNGSGRVVAMGGYQYSYNGVQRQGSWQNPPEDPGLYGTYDAGTDTIRVPQPQSATNYEQWFAVVAGGRIVKWVNPLGLANYPKYVRWDPAPGAGYKSDGQNNLQGPICRAVSTTFGTFSCP